MKMLLSYRDCEYSGTESEKLNIQNVDSVNL